MLPKGYFAIELDECDGTSVAIIRGLEYCDFSALKKKGRDF